MKLSLSIRLPRILDSASFRAFVPRCWFPSPALCAEDNGLAGCVKLPQYVQDGDCALGLGYVRQGETDMNYVSKTRFGINYRRIYEPFDLQMYMSNIGSLLSCDEVPDELILPAIEDFSQIDLLKLESDELKTFFQWRLEQPKQWKAETVVAIVKDGGSFGMMRMFGIYAELSGFRSEKNFYITTDIVDGVQWLLRKMDGSSDRSEMIAEYFSELDQNALTP